MTEQLQNALVRIEVDKECGTLSVLRSDCSPVALKVFAGVCIEGIWRRTTDPGKLSWCIEHGIDEEGRPTQTGILTCVLNDLRLDWKIELRDVSPLVRVQLIAINTGQSPVLIEALAPLVAESASGSVVMPGVLPADCRILLNTEGEGLVKLRELTCTEDVHEGWWDATLHDTRTGSGFVIGALSARRYKTRIQIAASSKPATSPVASLLMEQATYERAVGTNGSLESEPVAMNVSEPTEIACRTYAVAAGKEMDAQFLRERPGGWNSWYVPMRQVDERYVLENARAIAARPDIFNRGPNGFNYVLIDYGWQHNLATGLNEWDPAKFPRGMAAVARDIRDLGLKPGIWIAPAQIALNSRAFQRYPHIGVRSTRGSHFLVRDWEGKHGAMVPDCTLEAGRRFLQEQIREIICDWGYQMVVLEDTDAAGCWKGSKVVTPEGLSDDPGAQALYHDQDITPVEHHRLLVRTCIDAVRACSAEVMIVPCGGSLLSNTGLFNMNVCSPDGSWGYWGAEWDDEKYIRSNPKVHAQNLSYRYYLHDALWTIDREGYCVSEPRPRSEAIMDICSAALCGGFAMCGDDLAHITEERLQIIARCLPFYGKPARPVGLFSELHPVIWDLKVRTDWEQWDVVAAYNFSGDPAAVDDRTIDFTGLGLRPGISYLAFDFWDCEFLGEYTDTLTIPVAGRGMRMVGIRERLDHPQILGTDIHYTMGAEELLYCSWNANERRLQFAYRCPRDAAGMIFIHVPDGYQPHMPSASAYILQQTGANIWRIYMPKSSDLMTVELAFD